MEKRPLLKIQPKPADKALEIVAFAALVALWIFVYYLYTKMPQTVPTHFNGAGKADGFGDKESTFIAPAIVTILFIGLTFLQRKPHWYNYLSEITSENAEKQYTIGVKMMRVLKLAIVIVFGLIEFSSYKAATGDAEALGKWLLPMVFALVFIPIFYFLIQFSKNQ